MLESLQTRAYEVLLIVISENFRRYFCGRNVSVRV